MESPCVKPMRRVPWVTTLERAVGVGNAASGAAAAAAPGGCGVCCWGGGEVAVFVRGMSKSPLTSWRSGARLRRKA